MLDEFPCLVEADPGLPSIIQRFWDHAGRSSRLFLVLCGSAQAVMEDLQAQRAPLFGRVDVRLCVLCHTSGAEDRSGTGASVDFRVMIHRIHNARNLPSVVGVGVHPDGTRDHDATPQPYEMIGFGNSLIDFSEVAFPVWPSLTNAMPRDAGYTALSSSQQAQENEIRTGEPELAILRELMPHGGTAIDVGANQGFFAFALALAVTLQRLSPHAQQRSSLRANAGLWAINVGVMGLACGACACTVARWAQNAGVGLLNATSVATWLSVPITVLALDLVSYLWHRANHVLPVLWRFHQVHHSDVTFTASTALRFQPGELLLRVKRAGVCGTDLHIVEWDRWSQGRLKPPVTLGHEFVGEVIERGPGVTEFQLGDRVSCESHIGISSGSKPSP